jgi:hypothetical protein
LAGKLFYYAVVAALKDSSDMDVRANCLKLINRVIICAAGTKYADERRSDFAKQQVGEIAHALV